MNHLRQFGCEVYYLVNKPGKGKFDSRSKRGIFCGYSEISKAYRVWVPDERKIEISRDVKFVEDTGEIIANDWNDISLDELTRESEENSSELNAKLSSVDVVVSVNKNICDEKFDSLDERHNLDAANLEARDEGDPKRRRAPGRPRRVLTGQRGRPRKEYNFDDDDVGPEQCVVAEIPLRQAISGRDSGEWQKAISDELKCILKNDTWELTERPKNAKTIGSRIVLTNKYNPDGSLGRRKARIVAQGFSQRPGIDFSETFSPVVRLSSIRLLTAIAVQSGMHIHQLDITTAYLNGKLEKETYMEVPNHLEDALDFIIRTEAHDSKVGQKATKMREDMRRGNQVCRVSKALYGLKQAVVFDAGTKD